MSSPASCGPSVCCAPVPAPHDASFPAAASPTAAARPPPTPRLRAWLSSGGGAGSAHRQTADSAHLQGDEARGLGIGPSQVPKGSPERGSFSGLKEARS